MEVSGQLYAPAALPAGDRAPGTHWIGGSVGPEPVWTRWWRKKFPAPAGTRTPDHPSRSPALYHWAILSPNIYEGVSKSFRTGDLERELQMVELSPNRCSCIAILWVSLVSFAAITLCVASQRVFIFVRYRLSPETFGYTLVNDGFVKMWTNTPRGFRKLI
jgi:hypothetical protein